MRALTDTLAQQLAALSLLEATAVLLAIAYLLLAIRQNIWCWLCAGLSTAIYVYLFIEARLYMESLLNAFYFGMAVYGWHAWRRGGERGSTLPVTAWPVLRHTAAIGAILASAAVSGFLLARYSDAALPYVDSLTTFAAMWATLLVARKVLENWWYWLVIDAASAVIYWLRDLPLTALLFVGYCVLIPFGFISWRRSLLEDRAAAAKP
ncbi:MAG: nicotinamide riboside transporter PnuC [Woeseiaceae bacterium]